MKILIIKTDNTLAVEDTNLEVIDYDELKSRLSAIGVDWFGTFRFDVGVHRFVGFCDDNGKLLGMPVNLIASLLYANPYDCIVGNVLILADRYTEELYSMTDIEFNDLIKAITKYS